MNLKKTVEDYFPVVFLYGICAYFLLDTAEFTPDALLYPSGLVWILLPLTTVLLLATIFKKMPRPKSKEEAVPHKLAVIIISSLAYVVLLPYLGFTLSSLIYCPSTILALGYRRKGMALFVSAAAVGLVYLGFRVFLRVPIPTITLFGVTI